MSTSEEYPKCDRAIIKGGKYEPCGGKIVNRFLNIGSDKEVEHKICELCGKDFGNVQVELQIDPPSDQLILNF